MGYTAQIGGALNVEGSFNQHFAAQLTGKGLPDWMPSAVVNYDYPQQPLTFPSWSVAHLGSQIGNLTQGRHLDPGWRGVERVGLAEISCWESYSRAGGAHTRNLRVMRDMAARVFATGASFAILDVHGTTANPTGNGTIGRAGAVQDAPTVPDLNPDVQRLRLLVEYRWLERVAAG